MTKRRTHDELEALDAAEFERFVGQLLEGQGYRIAAPTIPGRGWDFRVTGADGENLGVEVKSRVTAATIGQLAALIAQSSDLALAGVIVVSRAVVSKQSRARLGKLAEETGVPIELWDADKIHDLAFGGRPARARIVRLHLLNIRGFRDLTIELGESGQNNVIIGRNGTGKSTLLRAIALCLAPPSHAPALLAQRIGTLLREGAREARITAEVVDADGQRHQLERKLLDGFGTPVVAPSPSATYPNGFFVCGYGVARGSVGGAQPARYQARDAVASLFNYATQLGDPELILRRMQDLLEDYDVAMKGLRRVLGLSSKHHISVARGGGVRISGPGIGKDIPLEGWADGYRMTFQWLLDLYGWALQAKAFTPDGGIQGVLLVDELEQHLHPSMQAGLLPMLAKLLPDTQIIATTHGPLVALSAHADNIIALHHDGDEICRAALPDLTSYSAQDVLMEAALFGTDPYSLDTRAQLDEQRRLASIPKSKRTRMQQQKLSELSAKLGPSNKPALHDDPVLDELRELKAMLNRKQAK